MLFDEDLLEKAASPAADWGVVDISMEVGLIRVVMAKAEPRERRASKQRSDKVWLLVLANFTRGLKVMHW
jgi:hypothetical protein